jgi:septum formation protein
MPLPVVLASASPRRVEFLRRLVEEFEVLPADLDETPHPGEAPKEMALRLATEKARHVALLRPAALVIGADTVVEIGGKSLGKPTDPLDAGRMLQELSGKWHQVITGVCMIAPGHIERFAETTEVLFRQVTPEEIRAYVQTGEPMDKAGAYAIQGGAASFVDGIKGSLTNVIGFPLEEVKKRLGQIGL